MKSIYIVMCFGLVLATGTVHAGQISVKVEPSGETALVANIGKTKIEVNFNTHEVQIGKPSDHRPAVIKSNCTYSKYPCSIVDWIGISVNGNPLFVPRSAFADLADLNDATISATKKGWVLTLDGGDASEGYIVKITFGANEVMLRTLASGMSPDQLLQKTIYYQETFDN